MMAGSHMIVGAALWAVAAKSAGLDPAEPVALSLAIGGALLPDIDHPQSWAGRKMRFVSIPLSMLVGHRGITHSALAVLGGLVALSLLGLHQPIAPVIIGYLSHLVADAMTPSGVPFLWPHRKRFTLNVCRTGSWVEIALVVAIAAAGSWAFGLDLSHLARPKF